LILIKIIPEKIISIGKYCFYKCKLQEINIPSSITFIGNGCFNECSEITIRIDPQNETYKVRNNVIEKKSYKKVVREEEMINETIADGINIIMYENNEMVVQGTGDIKEFKMREEMREQTTELTIEEGIRSIGDNCFFNYVNLKKVNIPDSLSKIGNGAFQKCTNLVEINLPKVYSIGEGCFDSCLSLRTITLPSTLNFIGGDCFSYCSELSTIHIPSSVISIGEHSFCGCDKLKGNIVIDGNNRVYKTDGIKVFKKVRGQEINIWDE